MTGVKTGKIVYTERAFEQDADLAMGNDIVRALVELITNADDAYGQGDGAIEVVVTRTTGNPVTVAVRDRAKGLSPADLEACFGVLGAKTSGFAEGERVRGLFGRGAKDTAAFGRTVFETIKDDVRAVFELHRSGAWTSESRPASIEDRARLGIPGSSNGLVATVVVERTGVAVPTRQVLGDRLASHVQLRELTNRRSLTLKDIRDGKPAASQLLVWDEPVGELLHDATIRVGEYGVDAHLRLVKMATPCADRLSAYSTRGIVIRGAHASFMNTLFSEAGPETAWVHGIVTCEHIDTLIREFDEHGGATAGNPSRLLRRDRDGLVADHPFTIALSSAVLDVLSPILESLGPRRNTVAGSDRLRGDLDAVARALDAIFRADLQRVEAEEIGGGTKPTDSSPIVVVPPRLALHVGAGRTLTVLVDDERVEPGAPFNVATDDPDVLAVESVTERVPHSVFPSVSVFNIRLKAKSLGNAVVTATDSGTHESASSHVRIHDEPSSELDPPTSLEWLHPSMSVTLGKERRLRLRAPVELAPSGSLECVIHLDGEGLELLDSTITLSLTADGWLEGTTRVSGQLAGSSATLRAVAMELEAVGTVRVVRPVGISGSNLKVELVNETAGPLRGTVRETDTGHLVQVYAQHAALEQLIGDRLADGSFEKEGEPPARIAIAEAIASTIADWLVRVDASKQPHLYTDADSVLSERSKATTRYLVPLCRGLLRKTEE